jgi:hypothetical protein
VRCIVVATLLAALAAAEPEPDAAVAAPARWVEPRGCASGSFRSRALPVVTEVEEAWKLEFEAIDAPPVHWDGIGYVVARAGGKAHLVAFDLATGRERARVALRGFMTGSPLLVWDHLVMLQPDHEQITGYRLMGRKLEIAWIFRGKDGGRPRVPVVHDNEIYCFLGLDLVRLRPGSVLPAWTATVPPGTQRPAIYGPFVFLAAFGEPFKAEATTELVADVTLTVLRRSDGSTVLSRDVCQVYAREGASNPEIELMVSGTSLYIGSPVWPIVAASGSGTHCIVPLHVGTDGVAVSGQPSVWNCIVPPAHQPSLGALLLSPRKEGDGLEWCLSEAGKIHQIATEAEQPDFFRDRVSPTVLGEVVYFGSWAADLETGEVLWRLPVKQVTFSPVPADGLVLVVDDRRALRAFRGRGKR